MECKNNLSVDSVRSGLETYANQKPKVSTFKPPNSNCVATYLTYTDEFFRSFTDSALGLSLQSMAF
jgi:hypothetical protein